MVEFIGILSIGLIAILLALAYGIFLEVAPVEADDERRKQRSNDLGTTLDAI